MIKYNPKTWLDLIFHSYSRKILKVLTPALLTMLVYTSIVCYVVLEIYGLGFRSTTAFHSLLGIVLGLILVFRKNSAYDRWWEGRKLWGNLVNNTRNFAFKLDAFLPSGENTDRDRLRILTINFVYILKEHLRDNYERGRLQEPYEGFFIELENAAHRPNFIVRKIYSELNRLYKEGKITGDQLLILDREAKELTDVTGACERIKNTPIPYSYSMYIKKFIFTYTITLPFGFVTEFGYFTIPIVLLLFFVLISIELISEEIEEPFGTDVNDLPTDELSHKIKENLEEALSGSR